MGPIIAAAGVALSDPEELCLSMFHVDHTNGSWLGPDAERSASEVMRTPEYTITQSRRWARYTAAYLRFQADYVSINADYRSL